MKLNKGVEWGMHVCMLLAFAEPGKLIEAARLAEYHELSLAYFRKTLQSLAQAGVVESVAGPNGGYRLAKPASDITFLDVLTAIEGDQSSFECTEIRRSGPTGLGDSCYPLVCAVASTIWAAEQSWRDHLARVSLFDLTKGLTALAGPEQHDLAMAWLAENVRL